MFDHTHIIHRLTEVQKIRLLTDIHSLADPELHALGVPRVQCGWLHEADGGDFPCPAVLARSWNTSLLADVAETQSRALAAAGRNHIFLPEAKTRLTPFGEGLSEDPLLAGELVGACLTGTRRAGLTASLTGYGLTSREEARLDAPISSRIRYTFLESPYLRALANGGGAGVVTNAPEILPPEENRGVILCRCAEGAETVKALTAGRICMSGSASAVQAALHNYRRLITAIEHGKATTGELEEACERGEAISGEDIGAALIRLLDFARLCEDAGQGASAVPSQTEGLRRRALAGSTVLLENRPWKRGGGNTLPLRTGLRVCVLGDMLSSCGCAPEEAVGMLTAAGCGSAVYARGYDREIARNDELTAEAVAQAKDADVILLLLGMDAEQERLASRDGRCALPAGQLALCDGLSRLNKPVVAVISSRVTPDMSFAVRAFTPFAAILLAPLEGKDAFPALVDLLMGRVSPAGRLPVSLCAREADAEVFLESRRVGPFVGYRYLDTLGSGALYPFGHGLTYTSFKYSELRISGSSVSFTVQNTGEQTGSEVAQVYLGLDSSAVLRPKKELVGFACVELAPGEKKTVTVPFEIPCIRTEDGRLLSEQGEYTLSVGASVKDIRLQTTYRGGADTLPPDEEQPENYLSSLSNILSQHYLMEAEYLPMKPSLRNLLFGIAALCLAMSVKFYDVLTRSDSLFLDIVAVILAVGAAACFVLELVDRRKQRALEDARMAEANAALFSDATTIFAPTASALFAAEDAREREAEAEDEAAVGAEEGYDHFEDVDKEFTFAEAARELGVLAAEKGISVSETTLRSVFASLAVSRLAVVSGLDHARFDALISLLGEYFACHAAVDQVNDSFRSEADVLFSIDELGNRVPRATLRAVQAAKQEPGKIYLAALDNVDPASMSAYFVPFARHAHAPASGCVVECHSLDSLDATELSYKLPENLWLIVNLKKDAAVCRLPDYVSEIATVNSWPLEIKGKAAAGHTEFRRFGYGQMEYLRDRLRGDFSADEETWKKVDRLEAYAARYSRFAIGNKIWLGMEMYMAALMSFGAEENAARDEAMAVKLMPVLTAALDGRIPREERGLSETLDAIFGEDHTALCRKAVKESGAELA